MSNFSPSASLQRLGRPRRRWIEGSSTTPADGQEDASLWNRYVTLVQQNRSSLLLWESLLDRLIWLFPGQSQGSRTFLWSLAELQHLAVDLALMDPGEGLTLTTMNTELWQRVALTVLHTLWPLWYDNLQTQPRRNQAYWELQLERLRLALRLAVLVPHWWKMLRNGPSILQPGILQRGGLLPSPPSGTVETETRRLAYSQYVGRWTGRHVLRVEGETPPPAPNPTRVILGELMHVLRPLFWAHCKYRYGDLPKRDALWKSWLMSLGLDVASLACLAEHQGNEATSAEWQRRKMRLLLYLLRGPCHETVTAPVTDQVRKALAYVPFFGNLITVYLQDWLYYWKVYHLEE